MNLLLIKKDEKGCMMEVHLRPRASRDEISGISDGRLDVRVTAPPVAGAANKRCVALLSEFLGVSKGSVEVVKGNRSRFKRIRIKNLSCAVVREKMANAIAARSREGK
jgi:uncharacterized protein (TIGR00251 family)